MFSGNLSLYLNLFLTHTQNIHFFSFRHIDLACQPQVKLIWVKISVFEAKSRLWLSVVYTKRSEAKSLKHLTKLLTHHVDRQTCTHTRLVLHVRYAYYYTRSIAHHFDSCLLYTREAHTQRRGRAWTRSEHCGEIVCVRVGIWVWVGFWVVSTQRQQLLANGITMEYGADYYSLTEQIYRYLYVYIRGCRRIMQGRGSNHLPAWFYWENKHAYACWPVEGAHVATTAGDNRRRRHPYHLYIVCMCIIYMVISVIIYSLHRIWNWYD